MSASRVPSDRRDGRDHVEHRQLGAHRHLGRCRRDGCLRVPVTLNPGANNYQFVLTDTSGAVQTISRTITYDNGNVVGTAPRDG